MIFISKMSSCRYFLLAACMFLLVSCTRGKHIDPAITQGSFTIKELSEGLPEDGLWRQNLVLSDLDDDGFPEIITPPPRKAKPEDKRPHIFKWDHKNKWKEQSVTMPRNKNFDYGGIAVADFNGDGLKDLVLAYHKGGVSVLMNKGKNRFEIDDSFKTPDNFSSRTVRTVDLNRDGRPDIVAVSEFDLNRKKPGLGVMIALNNKTGWKTFIVDDSKNIFSDSLDLCDLNGDEWKEIVIAPLTSAPEDQKIIFWGDKGLSYSNFVSFNSLVKGKLIPCWIGCGDLDGDMRPEIVLLSSGIGTKANFQLGIFKFSKEILKPLINKKIIGKNVCLPADLDNDRKDELIMISSGGISVWKYIGNSLSLIRKFPIKNLDGAYEPGIKRLKDGFLLAIPLGTERHPKGIRVFKVSY